MITSRQLEFRGAQSERDYDCLATAFDVPTTSVVRVRQVHGREVLVVGPGDAVPAPETAAADAIVTTRSDVVASVRVADCVPVLIGDRERRVVAAVHAGWRGTAAGVSAAVVRRIRALGIAPADLIAAIGPSIGPCCYQVDRAVADACSVEWPGHAARWFSPDGEDRWKLNLWAANRDQLASEGVSLESIWTAGLCTACHLDSFYSHRREGERAGRMVAAVRLPRT